MQDFLLGMLFDLALNIYFGVVFDFKLILFRVLCMLLYYFLVILNYMQATTDLIR